MKLFYKFGIAAFLTIGIVGPGAARAAAFLDGKVIKIVVPFAAGGAQDVIARLIADKLSQRLGNTIIIENKSGAAGLLAADSVAKAESDGTTLLMATGGAITIAPNRPQKLSYDPIADFTSVALLADTPMVIAVATQSRYVTLADLIADAKKHPGGITYASTGTGTISNLTGELMAQATDVKLVHVSYRGASPAIPDLISGRVDAMVTSSASIEPMVTSGQARVLATFTASPLANFPGVPTVGAALDLKGLEVPVWVGILAPAKTPAPVIERLATEFAAICAAPDTHDRFAKIGALTTCGSPAALKTVIDEDFKRWKTVITKGNIKLAD
jgi:tripartite-type tricarboxylate transporter receptor subunit TctC